MTGARTYPPGVPSWVDVEQPDVDAAAAFYAELFGWSVEDVTAPGSPGRYLVAQLDGQDVTGLGAAAEPGWNSYVAVDDIDAAVARIRSAGGQVARAPYDAGPGGRAAHLTDPQGASFRLWQPAPGRPGAQAVNVPGGWNFSNLRTGDPGAAARFYRQVFGWEVADLGYATMVRRPGYGDHLAATIDPGIHERQAAVEAPPGFADAVAWLSAAPAGEPAQWDVTFTVADRDATVATAERLGATVLDTSETDWTRDAVLRDPQGAELTASQFTPPSG